MASILAYDTSKYISLDENDRISIRISLKLFPGNGLAPNRRQAITWNNADSVHCIDAYMRY